MPNDEVERRAAELRARRAAEEAQEDAQVRDVTAERDAVLWRFMSALREKTENVAEYERLGDEEGEPHGFRVVIYSAVGEEGQFHHVCNLGVDFIAGDAGARSFEYYFEPLAPLGLSYLSGEAPRELRNSSQGAVISAAVELTVELMAHVVSHGSKVGTSSEVHAAIQEAKDLREKHSEKLKKEKARNQRNGCLVTAAAFLGAYILLSFFVQFLN